MQKKTVTIERTSNLRGFTGNLQRVDLDCDTHFLGALFPQCSAKIAHAAPAEKFKDPSTGIHSRNNVTAASAYFIDSEFG
jgi:hypothetical protein